jgi:hypothetical protein
MADLNPIAKRIHNVTPDPDDDASYRLVSSEDNEDVLVGRQRDSDEGWEMRGAITAAEAADSNESADE